MLLTWVTILFFVLLVVFFVPGLILVLLALWDLRQGTDKKAFFVKSLIGILLLVIALWLPSAAAAIGSGIYQAGVQTQAPSGSSSAGSSTQSTTP